MNFVVDSIFTVKLNDVANMIVYQIRGQISVVVKFSSIFLGDKRSSFFPLSSTQIPKNKSSIDEMK